MPANYPTSKPPVYSPVAGQSLAVAGHMDALHEQDRLELRAMMDELGLTATANTLQGYVRLGDAAGKALWVPAASLATPSPLYNAGFNLWQRGTSFASVAAATYTADGWRYDKVGAMVHDISRSTDVPAVSTLHGLQNYSYLVDVTTVDAAIAATDVCVFQQRIEGFLWLPYAQRQFTLGFWVKATKTGVYCVAFVNSGGDRSYVAEYTVNVTDTWEYKTVTVTASPTAGTWDYTSGIGLRVVWTLAAGSNFQTTAGAWQTGLFYATASQVNATDSTANNFRLSAPQMALGTVAIPFQPNPHPLDEVMSKRYLRVFGAGNVTEIVAAGQAVSTTIAGLQLALDPPMRAGPTLTLSAITDWAVLNASGTRVECTDLTVALATTQNVTFVGTVASGLVAGNASRLQADNTAAARINLSAEL